MTISHTLPRQLFSSDSQIGLLPSIHHTAESKIHEALQRIYEKHEIIPDSPLGCLLKNGLIKLIIGMHHMHDAVNGLNDQLSRDHKLSSHSTRYGACFLKLLQKPAVPMRMRTLPIT